MTKTVAEQLAAEAKELTFSELPPEVIQQVKRAVLDTVGVGFSGYLSESSQIIHSLIREMGGAAESTVFGSGLKTSCLYATLVNGAMVRDLDYMDRGFLTRDARINIGHHSEAIPPILAVGERQHSTGKEVITAVVLAYELLSKLVDSMGGTHGVLERQGWCEETKAPWIIALIAGRLLGLNEEQMANALAFAGSFNAVLGIVNSWEEEHTMARNLKFPYGAYGGILGALLAQKGFKGPLNVFEGHHGIAEVVMRGQIDLEKLRQPRKDWTIMYTWIKNNFAAGGLMHGLLEATLTLVKEHDIKPEDVAEVRIKTNSLTYEVLGNPARRRYPQTKYTATKHSYYCTAVAILDRAVGPEQLSDEKLRDPRVRELMDKVFLEPDPKLEEFNSPAIVGITTKKGEKYRREVLRPKGHPMNPMTDADVEQKFRSMAGKFMDEKQMRQIIDTVDNLEKLDDIGELVKLLVIPGQISQKS